MSNDLGVCCSDQEGSDGLFREPWGNRETSGTLGCGGVNWLGSGPEFGHK